MMRRCVGLDDTLVVDSPSGPLACNCGLEFDDAERSVLWPHDELPRTLTKEEWKKICEESQ